MTALDMPAKLRGRNRPILPRLEAQTTPIPFTGCRLFFGPSVPRGYGVISFYGRQQYAHRIAWQLKNGPIPEGMLVLHECDVPACINPDHLFLGTDADNMSDKYAKGRGRAARGEAHGHAKLSVAAVADIRRVFVRNSRTLGCAALARKYGVDPSTISNIVNGKYWRVE